MHFYQRAALRFHCTGCGACCTGGMDHYVEVSAKERDAIRRFLRLSPAWFRRRYLTHLDDTDYGIRLDADGRCPFLGQDKRCTIYPVRPRQCRTYPWWPELVETKHGWEEEAKRCEGMNQGAVVPLEEIERGLTRERRNSKG
jgi:Fe-S-cluster containining protein